MSRLRHRPPKWPMSTSILTSKRLRKKTGRTKPAAPNLAIRPQRACCRSCAGHPAATASGPRRLGVPKWRLTRRLPSRVTHLTTRWMKFHPSCSCLHSRFLADECNQPNCQRASCAVIVTTSQPHQTFIKLYRYHRPVQAARWHLAPAVSIRAYVFG